MRGIASATEVQARGMPVDYTSLSALVVEDNDFIRGMIVKMLRSRTLKAIQEATDGKAAIRLLMGGFVPDFIICDIKMQPVSGLEFAEFVRTDATLARHNFPVIILTGSSLRDHVVKAKEYRVDAFLLKPVSREGLFGRIEQVLVGRRVPAS
jgi:two-component system chemotaxis response regulator CheY